MTLAMKPDEEHNIHVSDFYRKQFFEQSGLSFDGNEPTVVSMPLIRPTQADIYRGREILAENAPAASLLPAAPTRVGRRGGGRSKTAGATCKPVVIHPGSGGAHKCWRLDNFLSVARILAKEGVEVVFLFGPAEAERFSEPAIAEIRTAGKLLTNLSLAEVLGVLGCSRGYIGNDSGITHLAAALGIRTVVVFGPTDPSVYAPIGPAVTILQSDETDFAGAISEELQQQAAAVLLA
jgi:hypothetical protein